MQLAAVMQLFNAPFYACLQALQTIYKTKRFDWASRGDTPAVIQIGGDHPAYPLQKYTAAKLFESFAGHGFFCSCSCNFACFGE